MSADLTRMMQAHQYSTDFGEALGYRLYVPDIARHTRYPLVVFQHGAGERGIDNAAQLRHGVSELLGYAHREEPALIVAPQCPARMRWSNVNGRVHTEVRLPEFPSLPQKLTLELIDQIVEQFPVDAERIYSTGLSLGGFGCWDLLMRRPHFFAAAMPVCGGADIDHAELIAHVPQWVFHGDADSVIDVEHSRRMIKALQTQGASPHYTEYPGVGHAAWTPAYRDREALEWLFSQRLTGSQLAQN